MPTRQAKKLATSPMFSDGVRKKKKKKKRIGALIPGTDLSIPSFAAGLIHPWICQLCGRKAGMANDRGRTLTVLLRLREDGSG